VCVCGLHSISFYEWITLSVRSEWMNDFFYEWGGGQFAEIFGVTNRWAMRATQRVTGHGSCCSTVPSMPRYPSVWMIQLLFKLQFLFLLWIWSGVLPIRAGLDGRCSREGVYLYLVCVILCVYMRLMEERGDGLRATGFISRGRQRGSWAGRLRQLPRSRRPCVSPCL
jgi:hypothetical protein